MKELLCAWMLLFMFASIQETTGKYVEGTIETNTDWEFITRFCFLSAKGTLKFTFEYPISYGPQNILLYFDTPDQWDSVYKTDKTCAEKVSVLNPDNNQIIYLTTAFGLSGCTIETIDGVNKYVCTGGRTFRSARERWWFVAVSRCDRDPTDPIGINLKYTIHMTNGNEDDYLHREYSADEFYIGPISIAFLIAYAVLCVMVIICAVMLRNRQLFHTTYKLFMASVFTWTAYLFFISVAYGVYGNDGIDYKLSTTKYAGRAFEAISIMMFLLMLILMGKGYTITRGRLSTVSTIKITVFFTLYSIVYIVLFVYEAYFFDPGLVLYLYESPPGYGLIAMRLIGWAWFCYAIFFTLKHYSDKSMFYIPFFIFYTLWFWAGPIVIVIATYAIALWSREKTVFGVECFVSLLGHVFFLVLTRPSAANKNFPYHVRTTQIGIINSPPAQNGMPMGANPDNNSFGTHAYAVSTEEPSPSNGPDLTGLFVTSKTRSKQEEAETSLNNNNDNPRRSVDLPPSYSSVALQQLEEDAASRQPLTRRMSSRVDIENGGFPSAPPADHSEPLPSPPSYAGLFRATSSSGNLMSANPSSD